MKRALSFLVALLLILCVGCRKISDGYMSSDTYTDYISNITVVSDDGVSNVDGVVSNIESDISGKENAGEVTVSRETSSFIDNGVNKPSTDTGISSAVEAGKQNAIVDSSINSDDAVEIEQADVNTSGTKPLYYNYLTDTQKQIYRFMKSAAENMTEGIFSVGAVSSKENNRFSDITIAFRAMSSDNPQIFWLPNSYITSSDGSSVAFSYHENGYDINYSIPSSKLSSENKKLNDAVSRLTAEANSLDSRLKKELYFHDWLCNNVTYGTDGTQNSYTAYGALVNGKAVCEGYSRAMQLLCDSVNIPCTVVYGHSKNIGHMWNIIDPGDGWYNLDVTWDDDAEFGVVRHAYFNVSNSVIKADHTIFDAVKPNKSYTGSDFFNIYLYDCNSMNYNYFEKNKLIFNDDMTNNTKLITDALKKGQTHLELLYKNRNSDCASALNQLNSALYSHGIYVNKYSNLGNAVVVWWTSIQ